MAIQEGKWIMSKIQLMQDWPAIHHLAPIPAGTVLDLEQWQWQGFLLPPFPPVTALALSQKAHDELCRWHSRYKVLSEPESPIARKR
jgi:hypothetical protein